MRSLRLRAGGVCKIAGIATVLAVATVANAQLTDRNRATNTINEGIAKTLQQQIGAGRGNINLADSSIFIINRDPARSVRRGRQLFQRKFARSQGQGPITGDGAGNINVDGSIGAGLADSCAGCHGRPRGSAGFGGDVVTRPDSRDAPHLFGLGLQEMLADEITSEIRAQSDAAFNQCLQLRVTTSAALRAKPGDVQGGIDFGIIDWRPSGSTCIPDATRLNVTGLGQYVNTDLRVRPFFAQGGTISIREFLVGAFNAEMGIEGFDPDMFNASVNHQIVTTPSGMVLNGARDAIERPPVDSVTQDGDADGRVNELDLALIDHEEFYLLNYFKPGRGQITADVTAGEGLVSSMGCTSCHIKDLRIARDRRVADVETVFNTSQGIFNRLFATASLLFTRPSVGAPITKNLGTFLVRNIHTDFRRHNLGAKFRERNFDGTFQNLFMTEPLWGVGSSPPYGHDGRSINLEEVILRHSNPDAEAIARQAVINWNGLTAAQKTTVEKYLNSLVLFPPDDTASTLDPGNPAAANFPQAGHGSIRLGALFNNPADPE
jgi:hypothetical protein